MAKTALRLLDSHFPVVIRRLLSTSRSLSVKSEEGVMERPFTSSMMALGPERERHDRMKVSKYRVPTTTIRVALNDTNDSPKIDY
jgi:hypothetical protein